MAIRRYVSTAFAYIVANGSVNLSTFSVGIVDTLQFRLHTCFSRFLQIGADK